MKNNYQRIVINDPRFELRIRCRRRLNFRIWGKTLSSLTQQLPAGVCHSRHIEGGHASGRHLSPCLPKRQPARMNRSGGRRPAGRIIFIFFIMLTLSSCGEWGWQKADYDFESQLNVFGMIMLGDELESYVIVQQSIDLQSSDMAIAGYDTIFYGPDSSLDIAVTIIEKSAYVVDDATVFITDGIDTTFFFIPPIDNWGNWIYETKYSDTSNTFNPQPNTTYTLHVSTPDGRVVVGELTTPDMPYIYESQIPDTVYNKYQYTIPFRPIYDEDIYLRIRTGSKSGYWECGMNQTAFIDNHDTTWTSTIVNCSDRWWWEEGRTDSIRIELQAMDQNYYDYFIKNSESAEYINFVMGDEGSSGKGFGLEGGMGVFGAMAIDAVDRVYIAW